MTVDAGAAHALLTEEASEQGFVRIFDEVLSHAERWIEDGVHVVRSTEFEVFGEGESLEDALFDFTLHASDYQSYLATLIERGEAAKHEIEVAGRLGPRLARAYQATAHRLNGLAKAVDERPGWDTPFFTLHLGRRRSRQLAFVWHPSRPVTSMQRSHA